MIHQIKLGKTYRFHGVAVTVIEVKRPIIGRPQMVRIRENDGSEHLLSAKRFRATAEPND
jgi:hypothetical protein